MNIEGRGEVLVVVAGLGRFRGAAQRIRAELHPALDSIRLVIVDEPTLQGLGSQYAFPPESFGPDTKGYGFYAWKPLIVSHYAKHCGTLVYIDAGCDVDAASLLLMIDDFLRIDGVDLVVPRCLHSVGTHTAPWVVRELAPRWAGDCFEVEMLAATFFILRTQSPICAVFDEARELALSSPGVFSGLGFSRQSESCQSVHLHRHDQSVFNLLVLKSPSISSVRAYDSPFTPPRHLEYVFGGRCPIIAGRNNYCVPLYWPLAVWGETVYSSPLKYLLKFVNYFLRLLGSPLFLILLLDRVMRLCFCCWASRLVDVRPDLLTVPLR